MGDDSKEFRGMFAKIPKNCRGNANEDDVYKAFRYIMGIDLLTLERFQAAKRKRFAETREFNYDDCAALFMDVDFYLEHIPFDLPKKSSRFLTPIKEGINRIMGRNSNPSKAIKSFIEEEPPNIPRPKTPPFSSRLDHARKK